MVEKEKLQESCIKAVAAIAVLQKETKEKVATLKGPADAINTDSIPDTGFAAMNREQLEKSVGVLKEMISLLEKAIGFYREYDDRAGRIINSLSREEMAHLEKISDEAERKLNAKENMPAHEKDLAEAYITDARFKETLLDMEAVLAFNNRILSAAQRQLMLRK